MNGETKTPVHLNNLNEALSKPKVLALVDLEIRDRRHETLVDRSYANIGFVVHRKESIFKVNCLPRGNAPPTCILEHSQQQQTQQGLQVAAGFTSHGPSAIATGSANRTISTTMKATDKEAAPEWLVNPMSGDRWNKDNKSYDSYDLVYLLQDTPKLNSGPAHQPLDVKIGMGLSLRSAASEPVPQISFIHRNLVPIWVTDGSKAGIRGIAVLMSSYLEDINTQERLDILEDITIDLGNVISTEPRTRDDEQGIISLSIAGLPKKDTHKVKTPTKSVPQSPDCPITLMPQHVYHARGWNANNNEWKDVWWPSLHKYFQTEAPKPNQRSFFRKILPTQKNA